MLTCNRHNFLVASRVSGDVHKSSLNFRKGSEKIEKLMEQVAQVVHEEDVIGLIADLVAIPSHPPNSGQEKEIAHYIQRFFKSEGIESRVIHVEDDRYNVTAVLRGTVGAKRLLLTGHMDTVPVYDMENPYKVSQRSGKLYGRGTVDMKGPLACMMMAMAALKRLKVPLEEDVWFAGVIDEEEKSLGTIALIEAGLKVDAAIVGEPTDLEICMAHRGLEWLEFEIVGKTVHGGRQSEGINAIQKATQFITLLEERMKSSLSERIHPVAGSSTMNLGTINGGTQPSTVAGRCVLTVDRRWIPGESYENVLKEYQDVITELSQKDPKFKCHMRVMESSVMKPGYVHEAMEIDPDSEIIKSLTDAIQAVSGTTPNRTYFPAWSDAGLLSTYANIPTIVFAPGQLESAHSKDEFISVNQLMPAVKAYALTAALYCKVKGDDA